MSERPKGERGVVFDSTGRRMRQLVEENRKLRSYVGKVMDRLNQNERLFLRLFELEVEVLSSADVGTLCHTLLRGLCERFDLDMARLWFGRDSLLNEHALCHLSERNVLWLDPSDIKASFPYGSRVRLISLRDGPCPSFLPVEDTALGSIAIMMLGEQERPFGILGIGSLDAERFQPGKATDFLSHLALFVTLGLENLVARQRLAQEAFKEPFCGDHQRFLQPNSHQPLAQWFGEGSEVSCIYLGIDGLSGMAESGDLGTMESWVKAVAEAMRASIRKRDPLLRTEADELAVLLPACNLNEAAVCASRVQKACNAVAPGRLSVSIGVAHARAKDGLTVRELIDRACQTMYVAKALGGGRIERLEEDG